MLSRRRFLGTAGAGIAGLAAGAGATAFFEREGDDDATGVDDTIPFYGTNQAGIATAAQDKLVFAAFDVTLQRKSELRDLLRAWSVAAAGMAGGQPAGTVDGTAAAPPGDTGEALGLGPARLTVTLGLGPSLFDKKELGLAAQRPSALHPIGKLPGDALSPERSDGDICVQACANDPQVAFHAVRNLARIGRGFVELRWTQFGFGRTTSTTSKQETARNLQGFKDGTNNLNGDDAGAMKRFVWVGDDEPQRWFRNGTYLVARRIRMLIESWDRVGLDEQEAIIGRHKVSGAPLTGSQEQDVVDLDLRGTGGVPIIPADAHIRLAAPSTHGGQRILRRGYSFTDGIDPATGALDAGLFFICFQRDPQKQFVAIQSRLGAKDPLNEYIVHTGGGLFAVPPGASSGGFVGEGLFA
jgi:deferrochelatase/peroxidase EfeB